MTHTDRPSPATQRHVSSVIRSRFGVDLFFRDWGRGPPVLLLAGWAMTSDLWSGVMVRLNAAGFRTIAPDRRGHGRSGDPGSVDYDSLADDLHDLMTALDLRDCTVVAHSGAGGEVMRLADRYGDHRIARLVLVGSTTPALMASPSNPHGVPAALLEAGARRIEDDLEGWIDENVEPFAPGIPRRTADWLAGMVLGCSRRIAVDYQREIAVSDFSEALRSFRRPTTVIHGDLDASAPLDLCGRRTAALIPGAELIVYEGCAHGPMVTDPKRLADDIALAARSPSGLGGSGRETPVG